MGRILITEAIAERAVGVLRDAGHEVDVRLDLAPDELLAAVLGAQALIVRSATQVTADVLQAGRDLVIVGRAGLGVDNIDVDAATRLGVMVANAPGTNSLSTAEHAMALLLSQARNIPQAASALKAGRWEKSRWEGAELSGKTLGVLGLGRIGTLVAQRAMAFGMRIVAWDPWVSADRARQLGIELLELDEVFARSDFVTIHLLKTKDSVNLIGDRLLSLAKPGLRIINAARGGIIDEDALAKAIADGRIGGAALDVFATEPITDSPLFGFDSVVVTPHLGASTAEAQDKAGDTIAEMVQLALAGEFVPFAVNVSAAEASETVRPFLPLAERMGELFAALTGGVHGAIEIDYEGGLADYDTRILTLSVLKGLLSSGSEEPVTYVNAPQLAEQRGIEVGERRTTAAHDYVNLITLRGAGHAVAGTLVGPAGKPRLVMVDDHDVEVVPTSHMLVVRNDDRNGMVALVTGTLAKAEIGIETMALGRSPDAPTALMVLATYEPVPADVVAHLEAEDGILAVHAISVA